MFETLINLLILGIFWQSQSVIQSPVVNSDLGLPQAEYRTGQSCANHLPQAELKSALVEPQRKFDGQSLGVDLTAKSVLAIDRDSRIVLFEKNADEVRSIASLTKLMTALVFLDHNPGWGQKIIISESDYRIGAAKYLNSGEEMTAKDVFYTALVVSANEGAVALSRSTGLTNEEFVSEMNLKAQNLGMVNTSFVDVAGLENGNRSTARELAILLETSLNQPDIMKAISTGRYDFTVSNSGMAKKILSTNWILGQDFGADGKNYWVEAGKTGHLEEAGYCFLSQIRDQNGKRILTVVLGSETVYDRFTDTKGLAYWVFKNYLW